MVKERITQSTFHYKMVLMMPLMRVSLDLYALTFSNNFFLSYITRFFEIQRFSHRSHF